MSRTHLAYICKTVFFQFRSLCNVRYRKFDFFNYPEHVQILSTYAFKPIIIQVTFHVTLIHEV